MFSGLCGRIVRHLAGLRNDAGRTASAFVTLLMLLPLLAAPNAFAHLMPAQQGTINLLDNAAFIVISLPVSALASDPQIDGNHDGRLSEAELQVHRAKIAQQLTQRLRLFDGAEAGKVDFIQINTEPDERADHINPIAAPNASVSPNAPGAKQFLVLMKISFARLPTALRLETDLFGTQAGERQFAIKASRGKEIEAIILRAHHAQHHFFRSAWQVFIDYLVVGSEHILLGFDHLLFLLTIIVAAAGWRYWLGVLTCFTIAHSITLTLALMGSVQAPANIIEPLIAASIVLMAALNLWQKHAAIWQRLALVFACGLLHGLGFASSISDMGLHGTYRLMSLLGFNLGIELGQAAFLLMVLGFGAALHRLNRHTRLARMDFMQSARPIASSLAILCGGVWMFERLAT